MCGVRECSNLISIFFVLISLARSVSVSYQCVFPASGEDYSLFSMPPSVSVCQVSDNGHSEY